MLILLLALAFIAVRSWLLLRRPDPRSWRWWLGWAMVAGCAVIGLVALRGDLPAQKLAARLMMPVALVWLGLWALAIGMLTAGLRRWAAAAGSLALLLTFAANSYVAGWLVGGLASEVRSTPWKELDGVQAVFVLGGGTSIAGDGEPGLGSSGDRVALAAELYHAGLTPVLVGSGGGITGMDDDRDLAAETATLWHRLGVPPGAIRQVPGPRTTSEELAAYKDFIAANGWTRVVLITSAWHLPRAMRLCRRLGITMLPVAAEAGGRPMQWSPVFLVPTGEAAQQVQIALWERLGMLVGR